MMTYAGDPGLARLRDLRVSPTDDRISGSSLLAVRWREHPMIRARVRLAGTSVLPEQGAVRIRAASLEFRDGRGRRWAMRY